MATFTNSATLTYNDNTVTSNIVIGELQQVLTASKTAIPETYATGDVITYVVTLINAGSIAYTGLTVTDDLGSYDVSETLSVTPLTYVADSLLYYVNGVLQPAPTITSTQPLVLSGITVPQSGDVTIIYQARVNAYAPTALETTITNTVTTTGGGLTEAVTATETITTDDDARLQIVKALEPTTVTENGQITYTFTIYNYGPTATVATDDVVLTDVFDPIIDITSVVFNGTAWTETTNYTYQADGTFATLPGQITVPAATSVQNPDGTYSITPGTATLVVTGTV